MLPWGTPGKEHLYCRCDYQSNLSALSDKTKQKKKKKEDCILHLYCKKSVADHKFFAIRGSTTTTGNTKIVQNSAGDKFVKFA